MLRINTGLGVVWELGGAMIQAYGSPRIDLNDWSVLAQHYSPDAPHTAFANTLDELGGTYLYPVEPRREGARPTLIGWIASILKPFPTLYGFAARILSRFRSLLGSRFARAKADPDIELVRHGVSGYNIIRYRDRYYAILQNQGEFIPEKAKIGGYSSCVEDSSLDKVMCRIATGAPCSIQSGFRENGLRQGELALEGFYGFNIIRQGNEFHAVLQSDWSLVRDELPSRQYRCFFSGFSLEEVQHTIVASLGPEQGLATSHSQSTARAFKP